MSSMNKPAPPPPDRAQVAAFLRSHGADPVEQTEDGLWKARCMQCGATWSFAQPTRSEHAEEGVFWWCPNGCNHES